jgi:hypothetical protein
MSFNGSGTFVINSAGQPVVANTVISATTFNALTADLANGLTTCITKDGQTTPTANIPMGGFKITNLANGTAATDAATVAQIQSNGAALVTVTGTDTLTGTLTPALVAYVTGAVYYFIAPATNTGAVTLNIDTLGAKNVTRDGTTALVAGDIVSGEMIAVVYDGTRFQLISPVNSFTNLNVSGTLTVAGATTLNGNLQVGNAGSDTVNFQASGWTLTNNVSVTGTWADIGTITTADINGGTIDGTTIGGGTAAAGTFTTATATTGNITTVNATTVDSTNLEVTNLKAKDGTAAGSIADSTGVVTLNSVVATTADINGGTIDATTIGGSSPAVGNFTTVSAASAVFTTATITTVNTTTLDLTNLEVTNIKAKDGTASMTIDDATGKVNVTTVSAASMNAGVAAVTSLTATGASVASANVGVAVITTGTVTALTATGASIASMNAGVALLTTATVTNFTASGASIASANIGNLQFTAASIASINAGVAVITSLTATGASIASMNAGVALLTTATVTGLTATGASITSMNADVALLTTATVTNLTATSASIASANVGTIALTRLDVAAASVASANANVAVITTGTVTNLTSTSASIASMNAGVALLTTATVTGLTATGASVASANVGTAVITAATVTGASIASANVGTAVITTGTVTNLTATSASVASANAAVALITTGTVTNLTSTSASIASANVGTAVVTGLTVTGASIASVNAGVAVLSGNLTLNGGTANGVLYLNGSKVATSGSALVFNGSSVSVTGNFSSSNAGSENYLLSDGTTRTSLQHNGNALYYNVNDNSATSGQFIWRNTNAFSELMRLTSTSLYTASGINVGIGTSSPNAKLEAYRNSIGEVARFTASSDGFRGLKFISSDNTGSGAVWTRDIDSAYAQHRWAKSGTPLMVLDESGNLGVGTTSAGCRFNATQAASAALGAQIALHNNASTAVGNAVEIALLTDSGASPSGIRNGRIRVVNENAGNGAANMQFWTWSGSTDAERARITSGGDLLVGTTSGSISATVVAYRASAATACVGHWNAATSGDNLFEVFNTDAGPTQRGSIDYNRAGGLVRYNTTSDYRAKDVYGLLDDSGETIDALKVYRGKMHGATMERPMLIAHEAQAVTPYAVTGEKDAVNENGDPVYQQMDTSSLVPLLIAEIQSLRARVTALESA